jgi:hypothetical protein
VSSQLVVAVEVAAGTQVGVVGVELQTRRS